MPTVFVKGKEDLTEVEYIGVFQRSKVIDPSPWVGGHNGGVVSYPVVVVKTDEGLKEFSLSDVVFQKED
ncbi:hypothetical protein [Gracilibacillus saliphilus]|uniref:hypothetical protein n=1 Tax=Gracilibacillus saliphilus TaxID=543890 RepID=UPI0013D4E09C|nr:hypothetical protein [Gracilibacillus saliphilus]